MKNDFRDGEAIRGSTTPDDEICCSKSPFPAAVVSRHQHAEVHFHIAGFEVGILLSAGVSSTCAKADRTRAASTAGRLRSSWALEDDHFG
jgi:hypothetical protein